MPHTYCWCIIMSKQECTHRKGQNEHTYKQASDSTYDTDRKNYINLPAWNQRVSPCCIPRLLINRVIVEDWIKKEKCYFSSILIFDLTCFHWFRLVLIIMLMAGLNTTMWSRERRRRQRRIVGCVRQLAVEIWLDRCQ